MSYTATHTHHHIHVPWTTIAIVAVAIAVATAVLILVNQPGTQTATEPVEVAPVAVSVGAAAVPAPESPALRRQLAEEVATPMLELGAFAYPRNHVIGTTLSPLGAGVVTGRVSSQAAPNDPHPFNHFPGEP